MVKQKQRIGDTDDAVGVRVCGVRTRRRPSAEKQMPQQANAVGEIEAKILIEVATSKAVAFDNVRDNRLRAAPEPSADDPERRHATVRS